ncbi:MAG TPA: phosphatase PAP2 family protein [Bryobacteraceae bacterium]|nr:phosphatase PAP2 family protein [Bryobacteraceae bacterium]
MRTSEWIIAFFFTWTSVLALTLPISGAMRARALVANAVVLIVYILLLRLRSRVWVDYARDWVPQALMILAYKQTGWFAPAKHTNAFEHQWIVWDRLLLDTLHGRALIESAGAALPTLLELSYSFVYAVPPLTMAVLYALGLKKCSDMLLTIYLLGLFLCYAQFPFWPSEPPRTVFAGQDLPSVRTPVRDFNLWLVGNYGIHTSVFPSAHVSGAFAAAMALLYLAPQRRRVVVSYFAYSILVAIATVYGRYHYAVDAIGGFIIGTSACPLGIALAELAARVRRTAATMAARRPASRASYCAG